MNKKIILPAIAVMIIGVSTLGASAAYAQSSTAGTIPTLIERIIEKFGLKKAEVQTVVDEYKTERQQEMKNRMSERLDEAVTDGDITDAQKQLILKKHEEMQQAREKEQQELQTWATENGIDTDLFFGFKHGHMGWGHGFMK